MSARLPQLSRLLAAGGIALLAAAAGVRWHTAGMARQRLPAPSGALAPRGSLPEADSEVPHPQAIPDSLPAFTLADLSGKPTSIATWRGRSLVINFWATWCAPCRQEVPLLKQVSDDWRARGVTVVGIAVDHPQSVRRFAAQFGMAYPLLVGEADAMELAAQLGMPDPAFPFTVFTDNGGHVVALFVGELHPAQAELILHTVQQLNTAALSLREARLVIAAGLDRLASDPS